jgi:hypothetical protein
MAKRRERRRPGILTEEKASASSSVRSIPRSLTFGNVPDEKRTFISKRLYELNLLPTHISTSSLDGVSIFSRLITRSPTQLSLLSIAARVNSRPYRFMSISLKACISLSSILGAAWMMAQSGSRIASSGSFVFNSRRANLACVHKRGRRESETSTPEFPALLHIR